MKWHLADVCVLLSAGIIMAVQENYLAAVLAGVAASWCNSAHYYRRLYDRLRDGNEST